MSDDVIDFRTIVRLVLKLSGLVMVIWGLVTVISFVPVLFPLSEVSMGRDALYVVFSPLVMVAFGLFLWLFPAPVTNTVFRKGTKDSAAEPRWAAELQVVGVSLLGLWLLYRAISDLVYHLMVYRARTQSTDFYTDGYTEFPAFMVATLVEFVVAVFFLFGARGIVRVLRQVRYGGLGV